MVTKTVKSKSLKMTRDPITDNEVYVQTTEYHELISPKKKKKRPGIYLEVKQISFNFRG